MPNSLTHLQERLLPALGPAGVLAGADIPDRNARDWSSATPLRPALLLRPRDTTQLALCLKTCHELGQPIVIQGGLTGLCGGGTPQTGEVALSTERMNRIESIDPIGMTATVQSGAILETLQRAAQDADCYFPLDFGSRGSCTLGGNLACNAGGNSVIRYGVARELCLGLEVVLMDGTVLSHLNQMPKNTSGFDLKQLFIGSEGTLGVIARAVLRLYPRLPDKATALLATDSFEHVLQVLQQGRQHLGAALCAFEVMWVDYIDEVRRRLPQVRLPPINSGSHLILLEIESSANAAATLESFLTDLAEAGTVTDGAVAQSQAQAESFWTLRDAISQLLSLYQHNLAFDVSLPLSSMQAYCMDVLHNLGRALPGVTALCFGHLGDGTLHYILDLPDDSAKSAALDAVLRPLTAHGGAVSAEHGIGMAKRDYLPLCRSAEDIATMRRLKTLFDPKGLLNPGRVIRMS